MCKWTPPDVFICLIPVGFFTVAILAMVGYFFDPHPRRLYHDLINDVTTYSVREKDGVRIYTVDKDGKIISSKEPE